MTMFAKLKAVRDTLASVPAFACDAETREALVAAIDELDDAMVAEVHAQEAARPQIIASIDIPLALMIFAGASTVHQEGMA